MANLREGQPCRVLVVEDDDSLRNFLRDYFDLVAGYDVTDACDSFDAINEIRRLGVEGLRFDSLSTDLDMPGMDGLEFIRHIKGLGYLPGRVVIYTGADRYKLNGAIDALRKELQEDATSLAVLFKPCDMDTLVANLNPLNDCMHHRQLNYIY